MGRYHDMVSSGLKTLCDRYQMELELAELHSNTGGFNLYVEYMEEARKTSLKIDEVVSLLYEVTL
jgi:hypothetical protein